MAPQGAVQVGQRGAGVGGQAQVAALPAGAPSAGMHPDPLGGTEEDGRGGLDEFALPAQGKFVGQTGQRSLGTMDVATRVATQLDRATCQCVLEERTLATLKG